MKALTFVSLSAAIRSRRHNHHCGIAPPLQITHRQNHQHPSPPPPPTCFKSTHQEVTSKWPSLLRSSNARHDEYYNHDGNDDDAEAQPSIIQCNTPDDNLHRIYQMNGAALRQLFTIQQQRQRQRERHFHSGQSAKDYSCEMMSSSNETESSLTILDRVVNCTTTASDDTDTSSSSSSTLMGEYEPEVYFVAIISNNNVGPLQSTHKIANDVESVVSSSSMLMGVITVQLRHRSPLIAGPSLSPMTRSSADDINSSSNNGNSSGTNNKSRSSNKSKTNNNVPSSSISSGSNSNNNSDLPAVALPTPHYYINNVLVEPQFRQRGIGSSLMRAIVDYCKGHCARLLDPNGGDGSSSSSSSSSIGESHTIEEQLLQKLKQRQQKRRNNKHNTNNHNPSSHNEEERIPIVLSVDTDNIPAVRLYEKFGFEYLERNDVFCIMVLRV